MYILLVDSVEDERYCYSSNGWIALIIKKKYVFGKWKQMVRKWMDKFNERIDLKYSKSTNRKNIRVLILINVLWKYIVLYFLVLSTKWLFEIFLKYTFQQLSIFISYFYSK